ncbi:MAG: LamG domain-containing protein, partial [Thiotrichaceae bacterium]
FRFKADDFDTSDALFIAKATGTSDSQHYWSVGVSKKSKLRFRLKTKGTTTTLISPIGTITSGQWYHVTVSYDGNKMEIYRDGELVASTAKTGQIDTDSSVSVAIGNQPANTGSKPFDGLIDNLGIYTIALNDSQIQTDNESPVTSENDSSSVLPETGLLSRWTLNESNGSKANDSIGNNTGTLINAPIWQPTQGKLEGALKFDGNNDRVDLGTLNIPGSKMSIAFWFKADDFDESEARFISKATDTSENNHYWMVSTVNKTKLRFRLKTKGSTTTLISNSNVISTNKWHHVAVTYDGNKMKIYRDGELVASTAKTGQIETNNSVPVSIGNQPANAGSRPFDGLIDDVRIYTAALNDNQVQSVIDNSPITIVSDPAPPPPNNTVTEQDIDSIDEPVNNVNTVEEEQAQTGDGSFILNWTEPKKRVDNTVLFPTEIDSFNIYYGTSSGDYPNSMNADYTAQTFTVTNLPVGIYYIVMTTMDTDGRESSYSKEVSKIVR